MSLSNVSTPTHTPYIRPNDPSPPSSDHTLNLPGAPGPHADDHLTSHDVDEGLGKAFGVDHPLFQDLAPEDSYDSNGTYWVSHRGVGIGGGYRLSITSNPTSYHTPSILYTVFVITELIP